MKYKEKIEKCELLIDKILNTWIVFMLFLMLLVICTKVILYKFFGISINWYLEVSQYCLINITYFGAALAFRLNRHISIDIVVEKFPQKIKNIIEFIGFIVITIFSIVLFYSSYLILFKAKGSTPSLSLPLYIYYFPICGGTLILCVYEFFKLLKKLDYVKK